MLKAFGRFIGFVVCFAGIACGEARDYDRSSGNIPNKNTPQKLLEAWLSFHATDLCQEADAVFVFSKTGMEVWSRIENNKSYQKFLELFEPLKNSYSVELYITRPEAEKKKEEADPPPSLWQNLELRSNLGEHIPVLAGLSMEKRIQLGMQTTPEYLPFLKQRLIIYAKQTLDWNKRVERYALDLSALARVAYDHDRSSDLKSRAISACAAHAQHMDKIIGKLMVNLQFAFPSSERKKRKSTPPRTPVRLSKDPLEMVRQISTAAQSVSQRVYHFIYPENYTVELDDLRNPSLLESLGELRGMVLGFEKFLAQHGGSRQ